MVREGERLYSWRINEGFGCQLTVVEPLLYRFYKMTLIGSSCTTSWSHARKMLSKRKDCTRTLAAFTVDWRQLDREGE